jgi:hypothetical protein
MAPIKAWNWLSVRVTPPGVPVVVAMMLVGVGDGGKKAGLLGSVDDQAEGVWGVLGVLLSVEDGVEP